PLQVTAATAATANDGDAKVPATFSLSDAKYTGADDPSDQGVHFTYDYGAGWKFVRITPKEKVMIDKPAQSFGVWVRGNNSKCTMNMRFTDSNGVFYQPSFGQLNFDGWRYLSVRIDDPSKMFHWGNKDDVSTIAYPIRIDTFVLVDSTKAPIKADVDFANFQLVFPQ
ncbi:MAG TPA: flagellar filament outer layer protein FlaA, partial [Armatimonadota bacterium]|nr:flagellar filament outer layer protein FlaA [Armatimonadota bacterium]